MEVAPHFLDAIGGSPANCVLLVGAGLSKGSVRRNGAGIPDWDALLHLMIRNLEETARVDSAESNRLRSILAETPPRYLDVAEDFARAYLHDRDGYERFLRHHLMPDDLVGSDIHRLILQTGFRGIASYNFDLVFEAQSDRLAPIVYPELLDQIGQFQRSGFFAKVHGCISRPATTLVLTRSSYETLRQHPNYRHLVATLLLANKVLCVGFSLRDPDFLSILADLKEHWSENLPPLFALVRHAKMTERREWISRGVDILSYEEHDDLKSFFAHLAALRGGTRKATALPSSARRNRSIPKHDGSVPNDAVSLSKEWDGVSKIEEMDRLLDNRLAAEATEAAKESLLFHLAALTAPSQSVHLLRQLVALRTAASGELATKILHLAAQENRLRGLAPHPLNVPVHEWVLSQDGWNEISGFFEKSTRHVIAWLLDDKWSAVGVDLWRTFAALVNRLKMSRTRHGLEFLYEESEHIPGAAAELERVVFAKGFVREDDPKHRWFRTWDHQIVTAVRLARFERSLKDTASSPAQLLREAFALDAAQPPNVHRPFVSTAVHRLLNDYVHKTHLTLHGSTDLYDPSAAAEILEALAHIPARDQQIHVLWEITHWPEQMRGLISLGDDYASLTRGLFLPLWWRYTSETRIEFLGGGRGRRMSSHPQRTGQDVLLEDIIGLRLDVDEEFREAFATAVAARSVDDRDRNEPRPLQEIWRERELTYEIADACPPELVRRVAVTRTDWESSQDGALRWREALARASDALADPEVLANYVNKGRSDYVIENLLARYDPATRHITLYAPMIRRAAADLGVEADALTTVAWIHASAHAFFHLGRDTAGAMWHDMMVPAIDDPDLHLSTAHEALAQFFSYKLIEGVADTRLRATFEALEAASLPTYRAWRSAERSSVEDMRTVLLRLRRAASAWPPPEVSGSGAAT